MKSASEITHEIEHLVLAHYYSEDFELVSSMRAYVDCLQPGEREFARQVVLKRLLDEGSMVDILLCSVIDIPSAVPVLAAKLEREPVSNQVTRSLISALRTYHTADAYTAVERFVDSDQEMEAIEALAEIDFRRTIPLLVRSMKKQHFHGPIMHILSRQAKIDGLDGLITALRDSSATRSSRFREDLQILLKSKNEPYNPFTESDIQLILQRIQ
jgi:hypothetical protein